MINALQTLDAVINKVFLKSKRPLEEKTRFIEFAIDGYRYLNLSTIKNGFKIVKIAPNALNRYNFPSDMEEFVGIGVPYGGTIWPLTRKDGIITTTTTVLGEETLDSTDGEGVDLPTAQSDTVYSEGGVNAYGYYTVDEGEREFIIVSSSLTEVLLSYISSGISNTDVTYIPSKCIPSLEAYILWQDKVYTLPADLNVSREYERLFRDRIRELNRIGVSSLEEMADAWRTGNALIK
jgi:hypothetical protein